MLAAAVVPGNIHSDLEVMVQAVQAAAALVDITALVSPEQQTRAAAAALEILLVAAALAVLELSLFVTQTHMPI
jgi:hypothetical protein